MDKITYFIAIFILLPLPIVFAQNGEHVSRGRDNILLNINNPSVFLTLDSLQDDSVLLRLHNNLRFAIRLDTFNNYGKQHIAASAEDGSLGDIGWDEGAVVEPRYLIENLLAGQLSQEMRCLSYMTFLPSGRTVIFKVPKKHLGKDDVLRLNFNYEWEGVGGEPSHQVSFGGRQIPGDQ